MECFSSQTHTKKREKKKKGQPTWTDFLSNIDVLCDFYDNSIHILLVPGQTVSGLHEDAFIVKLYLSHG